MWLWILSTLFGITSRCNLGTRLFMQDESDLIFKNNIAYIELLIKLYKGMLMSLN